jgi:autotransporter-associated beta strand protein
MTFSRTLLAVVAFVASIGFASAQFTETYTWTGAVNGVWEQAPLTNWTASGPLPPGPTPNSATSRALFNNNTNTAVSLTSTVALHTLEFGSSAGAFTIGSGGTISFANTGSAAIIFNSGAGLQTINSNITLNGALAVTNNAAGQQSLRGNITGSGAFSYSGSGIALLTGNNSSHTGTMQIASGIVAVDGNQSQNRLAINKLVTVTGGAFEIRGLNALAVGGNSNDFALNGGALNVVSGFSVGAPSQNSHAHVRNVTMNGGTINLSYSGSGQAFDNESFQLNGNVNVTGGTSTIQLGSGATTANSGIGLFGSRTFTVASGATLNVNAELENTSVTPSALIKAGTGTMVLNSTNSFSGTTTINAGTLRVNGTGLLDNTGGLVSVNSGGTLAGFGGTVARAVTVNTGGVIRGGDTGSIGTLNITGATTVQGAASNGGQITTRTSGATSGGSGTVADPFVLSSNSLLALGSTGTLNLDPTSGKFRIFIENDSALANFTTYRLVLATATADSQFLNAGTGATFDDTMFEVWGQSSANPFTNLQLVRTGGNLELTFTSVPEPGLMLGLGAGVLAVGAFLRRRFAPRG